MTSQGSQRRLIVWPCIRNRQNVTQKVTPTKKGVQLLTVTPCFYWSVRLESNQRPPAPK